VGVALTARLFLYVGCKADTIDINETALIFKPISGLQTLLYGMWFDMEYNKDFK